MCYKGIVVCPSEVLRVETGAPDQNSTDIQQIKRVGKVGGLISGASHQPLKHPTLLKIGDQIQLVGEILGLFLEHAERVRESTGTVVEVVGDQENIIVQYGNGLKLMMRPSQVRVFQVAQVIPKMIGGGDGQAVSTKEEQAI